MRFLGMLACAFALASQVQAQPSQEEVARTIELICKGRMERGVSYTPPPESGKAPTRRHTTTKCSAEVSQGGWLYQVEFEQAVTAPLEYSWKIVRKEISIVAVEVSPFDAQAGQPLLMIVMGDRSVRGSVSVAYWTFWGNGNVYDSYIVPPDPVLDDDDECAPGSWNDCVVVGAEHRERWNALYASILERVAAHFTRHHRVN